MPAAIDKTQVGQCVSEGLAALGRNHSMIVPGRMNRIMNAVVPASVLRAVTADMFGKSLAKKSPVAPRQATAG